MLVRVTLALLTTLTATAALAKPAAPAATRETLRQYCTGDYLSYCSEFAADTPEVKACFKRYNAQLSPNCRAAIASYAKGQRRADAR